MLNSKVPKNFIPVSVLLFLVLTLSEWIQSAVPYGTGFVVINVLLVTGRIVSDIAFIAGGIGLGIARAILSIKFLRTPSKFNNYHRMTRWFKSGLCFLAALLVFILAQLVTNFVLDSSYFGYYLGIWIGVEFSLYLLWNWTIRRGLRGKDKLLR